MRRKGIPIRRAWILCALVFLFSCSVAGEVILRATLDGAITPVSRDFVLRLLEEGEARNAVLVLLRLDTPGGLLDSTRDIVEAELASTVPLVVFVAPSGARAASAGAFITLAAEIAAMAPGTNIGAATPVNLMGQGEEDGDQEAASAGENKAIQDAAAFARSIAQARGRNVEWAESSVLQASSITASEAFDLGVIDLIAEDDDDLLTALHGYTLADGRVLETTNVPTETVRLTLRERLLSFLVDPNLVYVFFILGLYGLIYEFFQPGVGFGLAVGGVCLLLALFGLQILPVNLVGILLIFFGVGLMVLDAFTPTDGILTAGGIIALVFGSLTLFDIADPRFGLSWVTVLAVAGTSAALSLFVLTKGLMAQSRRPATGHLAMAGARGTVREALDPDGTVFVRGEYWGARSMEGPLPVGTAIRVERVEGRTLFVRRAP